MTTERYNSIDILKLFCAYLVILIHAEYPYIRNYCFYWQALQFHVYCISEYFVYVSNMNPAHWHV